MKNCLLLFAALLFAANASADVVIDQTTFPDANFRYYVRSQSYGSDGVLTDAEIAEVKSMYPWYRDIEDLTGISFNKLSFSLSFIFLCFFDIIFF